MATARRAQRPTHQPKRYAKRALTIFFDPHANNQRNKVQAQTITCPTNQWETEVDVSSRKGDFDTRRAMLGTRRCADIGAVSAKMREGIQAEAHERADSYYTRMGVASEGAHDPRQAENSKTCSPHLRLPAAEERRPS